MTDIVERLRSLPSDDWSTFLLEEAAEEIDRLRSQLHHRTKQADRLYRALTNLVEAGSYVSPIAGAVATKASVKDMRNAGNFMKATEKARAALKEIAVEVEEIAGPNEPCVGPPGDA